MSSRQLFYHEIISLIDSLFLLLEPSSLECGFLISFYYFLSLQFLIMTFFVLVVDVTGPSFWGRLNLKWSLCSKGKKQSPLDIKPEQLLFDPILGPIDLSGGSVDGNLTNTGRGIVLRASLERREDSPECILSNGPLSYRYSFSHLELHFGREMTRGSEHSIDGQRFPGEVQLYFFNSGLYTNFEEASLRSHGVAAVAVLIQLNPDAKQANPSLKRITQALKNITSKGMSYDCLTWTRVSNERPQIHLMPFSWGFKHHIGWTGVEKWCEWISNAEEITLPVN